MNVNPGLRGSYEQLFHEVGIPSFIIGIRDARGAARDELRRPRLQRAIGVIYRPDTERQSHYFHAQVARQFDALIHVDRTRAVEPLEADEPWTSGRAAHGEAPETYPQGL